jgi:serine/threonine-protein kinase
MVVAHSMLKDPTQRYGSADEFAADLDRVRRGLVPVAATAMMTAVPHEPTEFAPAAEATRIAPTPSPGPLLSGEKPLPGPTQQKRSRWPWLLVLLLVLAVGALAAFALGVGSGDGSPQTTQTTGTTTQTSTAVTSRKLEDLTGKSYSEAAAALNGYGLHLIPKRQRVRDAQRAADVVVASDPAPGQLLHAGDTVLLKVSRGQKPIPNIIGATTADALQALGADFKSTPQSEASDTTPKGKITRTDPPVGQKVPVGSTVTYWVSTGPASVQVPNLVGKSEAAARAALSTAGLIVNEPPGARCSDAVQVGQVAKQGTPTGTPVQKGKAISFDLANSPCTIDVPSVRGRSRDEAQGILDGLKVKYKVALTPVTEPSQDGLVLDQDIEGTNVKPFVVTITVGQLDQSVTTDQTTTP